MGEERDLNGGEGTAGWMSEWMICKEWKNEGEKKRSERDRGQESNRNIIQQHSHTQQREIQSLQGLNVLLMSALGPSSGTSPINSY